MLHVSGQSRAAEIGHIIDAVWLSYVLIDIELYSFDESKTMVWGCS